MKLIQYLDQLKIDNENILILKNVTAKILINNYGTFFIKSGKANIIN